MSGSRAKWLRREFRERFHRAPRKAEWTEAKTRTIRYRSRVRTRLGWLLGKVRNMPFTTRKLCFASEWRRFKTAWKRGGFDALETFGRAA